MIDAGRSKFRRPIEQALPRIGARRSNHAAAGEIQQPRQIFFSFAAARASSARNGSL
jgi:hypothetical protein